MEWELAVETEVVAENHMIWPGIEPVTLGNRRLIAWAMSEPKINRSTLNEC
jgi:hypothetical protein